MQTPDLVYALGLPPRDAVAYLESKGITPTRHWYDIWQEAQAKAVTVSGMTRFDLLEDVKKGLVDAVKNGRTGKMFIDDLAPILRAKGWTGKRQSVNPKTGEVTERGLDLPARLSLIFFQNVQSAYMYGRYRAMLANAEERPWWMYVAVLDSRTRPHHRALHRKVFRYDDPFWKTHYPPNGFYCRCRVRALSDVQLEREGLTPESGEGRMISREVVVNPRAPENQQVIREVWGWQERPGGLTHWTDTGFSYSAGYTTYQLDCELAQKLELIKSDALYAEVVQAINNAPARHAAFGLWIEEKLASKWKTGDAVVVGLVQPEVVAAAKAAGLDPARIAVVGIGYADGFPRSLSSNVSFLLHGRRVPQVGRICMDMCMVDITRVPEAKVGDVVTVFGEDGGDSIELTSLANRLGTIPYELMCGINKRIPRIYLNGEDETEVLQYIV